MSDPTQPGRYVGRPLRRREDDKLLRGRGQFLADLTCSEACELFVVRSSEPHAKLKSIDTAAARSSAGVIAVFTSADLPDLQPFPCIDTIPTSKPVHAFAIARDRVRYQGEPVALVLAEDRYLAEDAAEKIIIEYERLPAVFSAEEAIHSAAPSLYPDLGDNVVHQLVQSVGNFAKLVKTAPVVFSEKFIFHRHAAMPLETRGVLASWDEGAVTVWSSTQIPQLLRNFLGPSLGVAEECVRVIAPDIGGGFGLKEAIYPEDILVPLASRRVGRPVRWIEDRREHFSAACHAREETVWVEAAAQLDGIILGLRVQCLSNIGAAYALVANTPGAAMGGMIRMAYRIPHLDAVTKSVVTNKTPLNVYRGAGHPQALLAIERVIDRLARRLNIDRLEIRRRNLLTPAELPSDRGTAYPGVGKIIYDSGDYPRCFEKIIRNLALESFKELQKSARERGRLLGLGLGCLVELTGLAPAETARIRLNGDGTITLFTGVTPIGQGSNTALSQMAAEELQIPPESIQIVHGDTRQVPHGIGTFASRGGSVGGAVARLAAGALVRRVREVMAKILQRPLTEIGWTEGRLIQNSGPALSMNLVEIAKTVSRYGKLDTLEIKQTFEVPGVAFANACHAAIVEIDPELGRVRVLKYGVVHDCGPLINPRIVEGQIVGGVVQGLGGALHETFIYNETGAISNVSLMDYVMPNSSDAPEFNLDHLETPSPHNPFGLKGAGEGGFSGAPAAIVNAIEDALSGFGIELNSAGPFTPDAVLALLRQHRRNHTFG